MWANFEGKARTRAETLARIEALNWKHWKPIGITLHNTAAPTLKQWAESGPAHDARIRNLESYYENELGWHAGPHFFVSRDWINWFSNPLLPGVHSRCWNATRFGIEMVGDYNTEAFNSGDGAKVRDNAVFLIAALNRKFGFKAEGLTFHVECKQDNHDCPGRHVVKDDVIARVREAMDSFNTKVGPLVPAEPAPSPTPSPVPKNESMAAPVPAEMRLRMAKAIFDFEARRDAHGHLAVYKLPSNDGGGKYEVAGINDRFDKAAVDQLVKLIGRSEFAAAEEYAIEYIAEQTDVAAQWSSVPSVQSYLRDCVFNRGAHGAARIVQRALGVADDGIVGPITKRSLARLETDATTLLNMLRAAREDYERNVVGYRANMWQGLKNRWDGALKTARTFPNAALAVA